MNEQRAQEALRHLQSAALEMIEAARAALEVVEGVIRDPGALSNLVAAAQAGATGGDEPPAGPAEDTDAAPAGEHRSRVTRIPVS